MTFNNNWDKPDSKILETLSKVLDQNIEAVLITVVDVEGNAYRRPGAKMLVSADGSETGLITPGCLDAEISNICRTVINSGNARIKQFDLTSEEPDSWGLGVGCDGVVTLLFELVNKSHRPLVAASKARRPLVSLVVLPNDEQVAVRRTYYDTESGFARNSPTWIQPVLRDRLNEMTQAFPAKVNGVVSPDGTVQVFVEKIEPSPTLVIVGSGNDVRPVVDLANTAGFRTVVVGFRGGKVSPEKFSNADTVVSTSPRDLTESINIDQNTLFVLMTHNLVDDQLSLENLLGTATGYIGILGSRSRFQTLLETLDDQDHLTDADHDRVYAPVGLELGGETPTAIAFSIVSEALAIHNDCSGGHLRENTGYIHDRKQS